MADDYEKPENEDYVDKYGYMKPRDYKYNHIDPRDVSVGSLYYVHLQHNKESSPPDNQVQPSADLDMVAIRTLPAIEGGDSPQDQPQNQGSSKGVSKRTLCVVLLAFFIGVALCIGGILVWKFVFDEDNAGASTSTIGSNGITDASSVSTRTPSNPPKTTTTATTTTTSSFVLGDCPAGYLRSEDFGSCYRLDTSQMSWSQAQALCQAEGSYLVEYDSEAEFYALLRTDLLSGLSGFLWTGARRLNYTTWIWDQSGRVLSTGAPLWFTAKPNDQNGVEDVVAMLDYYTWRLDDLSRRVPAAALCKQRPGYPDGPTSSPTTMGPCPAGYLRVEELGSCYRLDTNLLGWSAAEDLCQGEGSQLLEIDSQEEFYHLMKTSLFDTALVNKFAWTSGRRFDSTTIRWQSGRTLQTTSPFWYRGKPNNQNGVEDCVAMMEYYTFRFDDQPCWLEGQALCEYKPA